MPKSCNFIHVNYEKNHVPIWNRVEKLLVAEPVVVAGYVPPAIEAVLTSSDIERELHYAGSFTILPFTNTPPD